jgi:hypothetical protein
MNQLDLAHLVLEQSLILAFGHQTFGQILLPLETYLSAFGHNHNFSEFL